MDEGCCIGNCTVGVAEMPDSSAGWAAFTFLCLSQTAISGFRRLGLEAFNFTYPEH